MTPTRQQPGHEIDVAACAIRQTMTGLSPDVRFVEVKTMAGRVDELLDPWKLGATMFLVFGGLALIVAAVGLYSLLAFGVAQRRRELGIRSALGAQRSDLLGLVMRQAGLFLAAGLAIGAVAALAALVPAVRAMNVSAVTALKDP